jgi:hypothetical protein
MISYPAVGVNMAINGNFGDDQIMYTYVMTGAFSANGYIVLRAISATSVDEGDAVNGARAGAFPQPASSHVSIPVDDTHGAVTAITLVDAAGNTTGAPWQTAESSVSVDVSSYAPGMYMLCVQQVRGSNLSPLIIQH